MSRYHSYEETYHERQTKQSVDGSTQRTEYGSQRNSDDMEKRLHSNIPYGDSISLESLPHTRIQSLSHGDSAAKAVFPIPNESFSHPLVKESTGAGADAMVVEFDGEGDPYRPMNWPFRKKVITTLLYGFTTSWITFASAIYSPGVQQIAHDFDVNMEVATTGISMVVFGFGLGPLIWAPLSEVYGRKWAILTVSSKGAYPNQPPTTPSHISISSHPFRPLLPTLYYSSLPLSPSLSSSISTDTSKMHSAVLYRRHLLIRQRCGQGYSDPLNHTLLRRLLR